MTIITREKPRESREKKVCESQEEFERRVNEAVVVLASAYAGLPNSQKPNDQAPLVHPAMSPISTPKPTPMPMPMPTPTRRDGRPRPPDGAEARGSAAARG